MDEIKNWAFSLCCAAVGGALFSLLLPDSSVGKTGRFAVQVFMLCCLILPLNHLGSIPLVIPQIQIETTSRAENIQSTVNHQIETQTANALNRMAAEILDEHQIPYQKIETIVNTKQDGSISIECIRILLPSDIQEEAPEYRFDPVLDVITQTTGIKTILAAESGGTQHGT